MAADQDPPATSPSALRYMVPGLVLAFVAMLYPHPLLLLLLPAGFAGCLAAALTLQEHGAPRTDVQRSMLAAIAGLTLIWTTLVGVLAVSALQGLLTRPTFSQAIMLALVVVGLLLVPWRFWPSPVLALLDEGGDTALRARLRSALRNGIDLTRAVESFFIYGLPVSSSLLVLSVLPMLLVYFGSALPLVAVSICIAAYALLVLPLAAWTCVDRVMELEQRYLDAPEELLSELPATPMQDEPGTQPEVLPMTPDQQLLHAAREGQVALAQQALAAGANPNVIADPADRDQRSALQAAVVCPDLALLRALIAAGVDLNAHPGGLHALIAATRDSYEGRPDVVMTLVTNGAGLQCGDAEGNTPLHLAARSRSPAVAEILLNAGAQIDALNHHGQNALALALTARSWDVARFLLARGANPLPDKAVPAAFAAVACDADEPEGVRLLASLRGALQVSDALHRTPLHLAALAGHAEICDALLRAGCDVNARDGAGVTPLMEAARSGSNRVLQRLAFWSPDVRCQDKQGRDALIIATVSRQADAETVRLLLALGCDPMLSAKDGRSALRQAVERGRWPLVAQLDPSFDLPASMLEGQPPQGETDTAEHKHSRQQLIAEAIVQGRPQVARQLIELAPELSVSDWSRVLHDAVRAGTDEIVELLLSQLPDGELSLDGQDLAVVLAALDAPPTDLLLRLLDREPPVRCTALASVVLAEASRGGALPRDLRDGLLDRGACVDSKDSCGTPVLVNAVRHADLDTVHCLLNKQVDLDACDARGRSALLVAIDIDLAGAERIVRLLVRHGASPMLRAADGASPLGLALLKGRKDLQRWLQWPGWLRPGRLIGGDDLIRAATDNDDDTCTRLLELGVPVDSCDEQGCTALLRAAGHGHLAALCALLTAQANPELAAANGVTPLMAAILAGHQSTVEQLLLAGARPIVAHGPAPLAVAAARFEPALIERLVHAGADPNALDSSGHAPLHALALALWAGASDVPVEASMLALLRAGAKPDRRNSDGMTSLQLLGGAHRPDHAAADDALLAEAGSVLLANCADPDLVDENHASALHWAAFHGLEELLQVLLFHDARVELRDRLGRRALDLAERAGHQRIVDILLAAASGSRGRGLGSSDSAAGY